MRRRAVTVVLVGSLVAVACTGMPSVPDEPPGADGAERGAVEEAEEQAERTELRLEALEEAVAEGRFGTRQRVRRLRSPGFSGERVLTPTTDDWEPALATDPTSPFAYLIVTRYGEPKPCPGNCPVPHIALAVSDDGGRTWSKTRPLCACKGSGQFDPIIEVVPDTGDVYALYMNGFNVVFVRSSDRGATWSDPVPTYGRVAWNDKPVLAVSDDGRHVYVSWNGPTGGDPWIAQSHDGGQTWDQTKLVNSKRYFFAFDADVLPDGRVVFAESSLDYSGPGGSPVGAVRHHAFVSDDLGQTWSNEVVDTVEVGEPCVADGCSSDFYLGHDAVAADEDGDLVYLYDGATVPQGPQRIFASRSSDGGMTWTARTALSVVGENATAPAVEQTGDGDVRAMYYQTTGHDPDRWNVWYRRSRDGGRTWSDPVRLSDAVSGADYKHAAGFDEVYGDYGEIGVTNTGHTLAVWGEGFSWLGPGGAWYARGR